MKELGAKVASFSYKKYGEKRRWLEEQRNRLVRLILIRLFG